MPCFAVARTHTQGSAEHCLPDPSCWGQARPCAPAGQLCERKQSSHRPRVLPPETRAPRPTHPWMGAGGWRLEAALASLYTNYLRIRICDDWSYGVVACSRRSRLQTVSSNRCHMNPPSCLCNRRCLWAKKERKKGKKEEKSLEKWSQKSNRFQYPDSPNEASTRRPLPPVNAFPLRCAARSRLRWICGGRISAAIGPWPVRRRAPEARYAHRMRVHRRSSVRSPSFFIPSSRFRSCSVAIAASTSSHSSSLLSLRLPVSRCLSQTTASLHTTFSPTDRHSLCQTAPWSSAPSDSITFGSASCRLDHSSSLSNAIPLTQSSGRKEFRTHIVTTCASTGA